MNKKTKQKLREMANAIRALSIDAIEKAKSGHPECPWVWLILQQFYFLFSKV